MTRRSAVGYGSPPVEHRFQQGQSGNPNGRPKGSRNISSMVKAALEEKVAVVMEGRRRRVSKLEAAFIQQANKAAGGDLKAMKLMVDILVGSEQRDEARASGAQETPATRGALDAQIMAALKARITTDDNGG